MPRVTSNHCAAAASSIRFAISSLARTRPRGLLGRAVDARDQRLEGVDARSRTALHTRGGFGTGLAVKAGFSKLFRGAKPYDPGHFLEGVRPPDRLVWAALNRLRQLAPFGYQRRPRGQGAAAWNPCPTHRGFIHGVPSGPRCSGSAACSLSPQTALRPRLSSPRSSHRAAYAPCFVCVHRRLRREMPLNRRCGSDPPVSPAPISQEDRCTILAFSTA